MIPPPNMRPDSTYLIQLPKAKVTHWDPFDSLVVNVLSADTTPRCRPILFIYCICLDVGAEISVSGWTQARVYCYERNIALLITPSVKSFKLGEHITQMNREARHPRPWLRPIRESTICHIHRRHRCTDASRSHGVTTGITCVWTQSQEQATRMDCPLPINTVISIGNSIRFVFL